MKEPCTYFLPPVIQHSNRNVLEYSEHTACKPLVLLLLSTKGISFYYPYAYFKCSSIAFSEPLQYNPVLPIQAHIPLTQPSPFGLSSSSSVNVLPHCTPTPTALLHFLVLTTRNAFSFTFYYYLSASFPKNSSLVF